MNLQGLELFKLLPAVYRIRDGQLAQSRPLLTAAESAQLQSLLAQAPPLPAELQLQLDQLKARAARGPLESLLLVIQEQLGVVSENLDQLYDDQFIETCAPWVIPYIGDLIGYQSVHGIAPAVDDPRAGVANTISFRRRKGTVLVMEQLARDTTGWGAHAVEFFRVLATTQYLNHLRPDNHYAPDLRRWQPRLYQDTGFDRTAHKVDVRRIASERGRYNIQNIGIFLWSLNAYSVTQAAATPVSPASPNGQLCYRFSPLGMDIPLFHKALSQGSEITAPARPVNVPDRLRCQVLCADIQRGVGASYYGASNSLAIYNAVPPNNQPFNPFQIRVCDLSGTDGNWNNVDALVSPYNALVDPALGRLVLPAGTPVPAVSYEYGFNADIGGGEYARTTPPEEFIVTDPAWVVAFPAQANLGYTNLQGAIDYAIAQLAENGQVAVEISGTQTLELAGTPALTINLPPGTTLELRAAENCRSTLLLSGEISVIGGATSTFALNGLLLAGSPGIAPNNVSPAPLVHAPAQAADGSLNQLSQLKLTHCTLLPGWCVTSLGEPVAGTQPTLVAEADGLQVTLQKSIVGGVRASEFVTVNACDCVIDATSRTNLAYAAVTDGPVGGGALTLLGCTVIGQVHATLLTLVSNSIFWAEPVPGAPRAPLYADRRQAGCVRFSFLPTGAVIPRHFECVEEGLGSPQPLFVSLRYGAPGYCKLFASTPDVIRRGAEDDGEMGVFHFVLAPLRETDLQVRMQEYLPAGLEFGIFYET